MVEDYIKETIIGKISKSLKIDLQKIDTDESFADYGVDSITGINLIQTINRSLEIELRIHLPTYPFVREDYWAPVGANGHMPIQGAFIHPLLHQNTSVLAEQRFSSTFTGREFFFADDIVKGRRVLPGTACLEMARVAVAVATNPGAGTLKNERQGIRLKNVVWGRPVMVEDQPTTVQIRLFPEESGNTFYEGEIVDEIAFEIYSEPPGCCVSEEIGVEPVVHCQGKVVMNSITEIPPLDLNALKAQCNQNTFSNGPGEQGVEEVYLGPDLVLAKLTLPASIMDTTDQYLLHPVMMQAALQASRRLTMKPDTFKPVMPLALEELEIHGKCCSTIRAVIRYHGDGKTAQSSKLDIDLCDEQGTVWIRMRGYSAGVLENETGLAGTSAMGTLMFKPNWREQPVFPGTSAAAYTRRLVICCGLSGVSLESIAGGINGVRCLSLQSKRQDVQRQDIAQWFPTYAVQVFTEIQAILLDKFTGKALVQLVVPNQGEEQLCSGLSGLLKTAWLENPKLLGQIIEVDPGEAPAGIIAKLEENAGSDPSAQVRYQDGRRYLAGWSEMDAFPDETSRARAGETESIPWKDGGIYLISGGAGGLGMIFAREISRTCASSKAKDVTLILTGRSPLGGKKQAQIKQLETGGVRVQYWQVDVTDRQAVTGLIQSIREKFGGLHGIIHSAGIIKDSFIIKKTQDEFLEVLAPKVAGLVNLDLACRDLELEFFVLFSSVSGSLGNPGQADYATANAFMDAFAGYRNALVTSGQRYGRTLAINWPLWQEGGMRPNAVTESLMTQQTGMVAMRTRTGIQALERALASGEVQVLVMTGEMAKMRACWPGITAGVQTPPALVSIPAVAPEQLHAKTIQQLKVFFGETIKLSIARIDPEEPLESYGIDSVMIIQLNQKLNGIFNVPGHELSRTLFYEYQTLGALAEYLIAEYPQECLKWTGLEAKAPSPEMPDVAPVAVDFAAEFPVLVSRKVRRKGIKSLALTTSGAVTREPIAIIGISGRYPQARNLREYWNNLAAGKDCITEIPKERWAWEWFYQPDPQTAVAQGKSYSKWGGFVEGFADFDPLFFNIAPAEAFNMDPQERLFIESCWEVLEDAGYTKAQLQVRYQGRVGVFAGITKTGFDLYGPDLWRQGEAFFPSTSFSSVANRVSYLLNLNGPSMPVDTMCSASLTAIHEACEHLLRRECELAIAGGVNLYLHPSSYIGLCAQQMLSKDGQCKSFGKDGNGFVPGEGVGVVLLKRLSLAVADQDQIYAVIRGTSINHGGKTNGYTVPNPKAQGELIRSALDKAGVNARTVSYVEAHGTGTELGDPIEITGLTQAFRQDTEDIGYCSIGSVKSNIGHPEAAAGIAGLTKIILQMQHGQIVPSLHATELNPHINFAQTPFAVQQELMEWKRPVVTIGGVTREYPRIAGISSFGAGGANAHVVLEEYIPQERWTSLPVNLQKPAVFVLSAKNEERLKEQVRQILAVLRTFTDEDLADMAYTIQVGREAMEERLAVLTGSIGDLEEKLKKFMEGREGIIDLYRGQAKRNKETLAVLTDDEEMAQTIEAWIAKGKYFKLIDLWVNGLVFDWNRMYGEVKPRRISLPAYPFVRERYWLPNLDSNASGAYTNTIIHPLLHQNTSDFSEQRYSTTFTGRENFLADHLLQGRRILPGVVLLEMARAAVEAAVGTPGEDNGFRLRNVVWDQPVVVEEQPVRVHIGLYPEANGMIDYEIYGDQETKDGEPVVYSQGNAVFVPVTKGTLLDLTALQAEFNQGSLTSTEVYESYRTMGIDYGPSQQVIEKIYRKQGQVLAKLALPASIADTGDQFILHPSILNAALQAALGLIDHGISRGSVCPLAFKLEELELYGKCTAAMWAWLRTNGEAQTGVPQLNIDLCDEQGTICVMLKGYVSRVPGDEFNTEKPTARACARAIGSLMFAPIWKEAAIQPGTLPKYPQHLVILCEPEEVSPEAIAAGMNGVRCLGLSSKQQGEELPGIEQRFPAYALRVSEEIQSIFKDKSTGKALLQVVVAGQAERQLCGGLSGLLKTVQAENPKLVGQLIELDAPMETTELIAKLKENSSVKDQRIRYADGKRMIAGWSELEVAETKIPWKDQGVYLITGGAGGLGRIFAAEIARNVKASTLVLAGRSTLSPEQASWLKELETLGAKVSYRQADIADRKAVNRLIRDILAECGGLDGIIHGAGIIRDNYLIKKTKEELQAVLAPKVAGVVNLDAASQDLKLDFFICFSSVAGSMGSPGQAELFRRQRVYGCLRRLSKCPGNFRPALWPDAIDQLAAMERRRNAGRSSD